jgi:hypothetical protein
MAAMLVFLTMDANEKSFVHGTPTWRRWRHVKTKNCNPWTTLLVFFLIYSLLSIIISILYKCLPLNIFDQHSTINYFIPATLTDFTVGTLPTHAHERREVNRWIETTPVIMTTTTSAKQHFWEVLGFTAKVTLSFCTPWKKIPSII